MSGGGPEVPVEGVGMLPLLWDGGPMVPTLRGGREGEMEDSNGGDFTGAGGKCCKGRERDFIGLVAICQIQWKYNLSYNL